MALVEAMCQALGAIRPNVRRYNLLLAEIVEEICEASGAGDSPMAVEEYQFLLAAERVRDVWNEFDVAGKRLDVPAATEETI